MKCTIIASTMSLMLLALTGCQGTQTPEHDIQESNLTPGMAKRTITLGQTVQAEILEVFGPPDLVTHRDGAQIWTYDKIRYDIRGSSQYFTIAIAGAESSRVTSSSVSTMLIIYFDGNDVVKNYRLNTTKF